MPAIPRFPNQALLSQAENRESDSSSGGPVAIIGLIIAALTLIVGILALRGRGWASYLLPSRFVRVYPPLFPLTGHILYIISESQNLVQEAPDGTPLTTITTRRAFVPSELWGFLHPALYSLAIAVPALFLPTGAATPSRA
ncbi:hypothetical protein HOY80DRAFT_1045734 [Tuber brumale]|nr:hypothetical protein HOY80DRAFT_1045734 [Tuber brumale]